MGVEAKNFDTGRDSFVATSRDQRLPEEVSALETIFDRAKLLVGHTEHDDGLFNELDAALNLPRLRELAVDPGSVSHENGWRRTTTRLQSNLGLGVVISVRPESDHETGQGVTVLYERNGHEEVRIANISGHKVAKVIRTEGTFEITVSGRDAKTPGSVSVRPSPRATA